MTDDMRNSDPDPLSQPHGAVIPEDQAKQGRRGRHMLVVLGASLALVLLAFGGLYVFRSHPATDATPAAAAARTAGTPGGS